MVFLELLKEKNILVWKHFAHIGRGLHLVPNVEDLTEITCVDLARTVLMTFTLEWFLKVLLDVSQTILVCISTIIFLVTCAVV